ncbi:DNA methyltransferase [Streptomyces sp. NPDC054829]
MGDTARKGFYLYESLDLLFRKVQDGYRPRRTHGVDPADADAADAPASEDVGLRFEPLHSKLFERDAIQLIGADSLPDPRYDSDEALARGEEVRYLDTRLRNATLHQVLHSLMITQGRRGERGGFISYAQLGINQLGAVYEGLMSYSGFIADEELYEVARRGDPKDGSWLVPASKIADYDDSVFVRRRDRLTGEDLRVRYAPGTFVYRLSGRDRQTSASYYTPESLTRVTVQLALQQLLTETTRAKDLLNWRICEPALGSGAFLNEAINQVAAEYLRRRQAELGQSIDTDQYAVELQKVKAYIALHNSYGVDLNETAVELAEVSLWLNTMHPGMEAPWFGLHLRRGNSLIGGRREVYAAERLKKGGWLGTTPERFPLTEALAGAPLPEGAVHHFLLPAKEWGAVAAEKEAKALAPAETKALAAWRKAVTKSPTAKQTARLQGLARRAEYLWGLVVRRLELSERDISRDIQVWGAEDDWLRRPPTAVQRDEILADLQAEDTPYWRLKTLMDAWCALWFWPVQNVALLDGTDERYARAEALAARAAELEAASGGADTDSAGDDVLLAWEAEALPGFAAEPQQMTLTRDSVARRRTGRRKGQIGDRREVVALTDLDDWIEFAEALLGTQDVPAESLVSTFDDLDDLSRYEDELPEWMGMDRFHALEERFLWAGAARDVAKAQGFFHWELEFAQVFARGGFELQVGNPPWVRPRWREDLVLGEIEPWFTLTERPGVAEWRLRKQEALDETGRNYYLKELAANTGSTTTIGSGTTYPLLVRTQPDLYRAFMCRAWSNMDPAGTAGMIHPDTHFSGSHEGNLRAATYRHLRFHAHFSNRLLLFTEIEWTRQFSVNIYGPPQRISFNNASWIFLPDTLIASLTHDGQGQPPGIKNQGAWDVRPHQARVIPVNEDLLTEWRDLAGHENVTADQSTLLYPVTSFEEGAIRALSNARARLSDFAPHHSPGYHEKSSKQRGIIRWFTDTPESLSEAILQGPHFGVATPWNKQPDIPCRLNRDWSTWDLTQLPAKSIPRTNYVRASDKETFISEQEDWDGRPCTEYFRLAWRRMIPFDTERSLFAAILPPGPSHVDAVVSIAFSDHRLTVMNAGFWASLPLDYLLRITGRSDLRIGEASKMPAPDPEHPLANALLIRALRLNCLTSAYAPLWNDLLHSTVWKNENWATQWPNLARLATPFASPWNYNSPLRTEHARRAALVELDALVSVWLGITADQLVAIFKSRYPILGDYEAQMYFDATGRRIAGNYRVFGHGQTKDTYPLLLEHLANPTTTSPPEGYQAPFYKADREAEMRAAHAHFQARLDAEIAAGRWAPPARKQANA